MSESDGGTLSERVSTLSFDEDYVVPILEGEKTATVRYDDADHVAVGDELSAVTEKETSFATIEITRTATANAVEALSLIEVFGAEYPTETVDELLEGVNQHYDHGIRPSTTVRVVVFEVLDDE